MKQSKRFHNLSAAAALTVATLTLGGCTDELIVVDGSCAPILPPANVYSVTGDNAVFLYWTPVQPDRVREFIVYRAPANNGPYSSVGRTTGDAFVDRRVQNGITYFYAVTAVTPCGDESQLSPETVFDTPRPEGFGDLLFDAEGNRWERSGWDFSTVRSVPWDHPDADIYFITSGGVSYVVGADLDTDVQDAGYGDFDDVSWAPAHGWSPTGTAEAIPGHVVLVWTRDNHFAKVRIAEVHGDRMEFDWGYQTARGNPELAPRPQRDSAPASVRPQPTAQLVQSGSRVDD